MSLKLRTVFSVVFLLQTLLAPAHADPRNPISPNPDDYDVVKYQRQYDQAVTRVQQAQGMLNGQQANLDQATALAGREQAKLDSIRTQLGAAQSAVTAAQARIRQLQDGVQAAQTEIASIDAQLPTLGQAVAAETQRRDAIQAKIPGATSEATRLENAAAAKEASIADIRRNAETKKASLESLKRQLGELQAQVQALQTQRANVQAAVDGHAARIRQIQSQIDTANASLPRLQNELVTARQALAAAETAAADAEAKARAAQLAGDPRAPMLAAQAQAMRQNANRAKQTEERSKDAVERAEAAITRGQAELADANAQLDRNNAQLAQLTTDIQAASSRVSALQPQVDAAQRESDQAQAAYQAVKVDADRARAEANQAKALVTSLQSQLAESERKIVELQAKPAQLRARQTELRNQIAASNVEIPRQQQALATATQQGMELSRQQGQQTAVVDQAMRSLAQVQRNRDLAAGQLREAQNFANAAGARLAQVQDNLSRGIAIAQNEGRMEGSDDGHREGLRQGTETGSRDGNDVGNREGTENGRQEGINRARAAGSQQGTQAGNIDGTQKGEADGTRRGQAEGTAKGRTEGLVAGYEAGRRDGDAAGYAEGTSAGHAAGGYAAGNAVGNAQGTARATSEANARGHADGYAKAEQEYYGAELANTTLSNSSAPFDRPGGWRPLSPRHDYPSPVLRQAYEEAYRAAFQQSAAESYDRAYRETYRRAYDSAYPNAYATAVNADYTPEYQSAYAQAFQAAAAAAFTRASNAAYQASYQPAYDQAYAAALPERNAEGNRDGRAQGFDRGKTEAYSQDYAAGKTAGDKQGYDQAYPVVYGQAQAKGYQDGAAYFSTNAVLRLDGALLSEANSDGVFAPNEAISVSLAVKNFGKIVQNQDVTLTFANPTAGIVIGNSKATLVKIPGQTRAMVTGIGQLSLAPGAEAGSRQTVDVLVTQSGQTLGQYRLALNVSFPYSLPSVTLPDFVMPNADNQVSVQVRNVSTAASARDVTVKLVSLDGLATVAQGTAPLGRLGAGETLGATLSFNFTDANAFRAMAFEVQVFEGEWLLGKRRFTVDSSKRWTFNPNAAGLIVVAATDSAKRAEEAGRYAGLAYDLWDVRVEGQLTAEAALKYLDKELVLPAVSSALQDATARAVKAVLDRDGHVFAELDSGSERTSVGMMIAQVSQNLGKQTFSGLNVAQGNYFGPAGTKPLIATVRDTQDGDARGFAVELGTFDLVSRSIGGKINVYLSLLPTNDAARIGKARDAILLELIKEMMDDKALDGDNFKNNPAKTRLAVFVNTTLTKTGNERTALMSYYDALNDGAKDAGGIFSSRRSAIQKLIKPIKK